MVSSFVVTLRETNQEDAAMLYILGEDLEANILGSIFFKILIRFQTKAF